MPVIEDCPRDMASTMNSLRKSPAGKVRSLLFSSIKLYQDGCCSSSTFVWIIMKFAEQSYELVWRYSNSHG